MVRNVATPPSASVRVSVARSANRKRRASAVTVPRVYPVVPGSISTHMDEVNELGRDAFVERFGPLFEHSPWVAADAWSDRPFADMEELFEALRAAMYSAPRERQLALIRAHPDLAGRAAIEGALTESSSREQASAGLDRLTPDEY